MRTSVFDPELHLSKKALEASRLPISSSEKRSDKKILSKGLNASYRVMPNHIARASLFAPIARGRKVVHFRTILASRCDVVMTYSGEQFNEQQADVWMQLIFESRNIELGKPTTINRAKFLKDIGRSTSGRDYRWLKETMVAFTAATLVIEVFSPDGRQKYSVGRHKAFHMMSSFDYDPITDMYTFIIDPQWQLIFGVREYSLIDWKKRMRIRRGQDLAKAIQRIICASSNREQKFELQDLKYTLQYGSPMNKFRRSLREAIAELTRVGIIENAVFKYLKSGEEGLVIWHC